MMRTCPDCRAPNPARFTDCYACGQSLAKRRAGLPAPGEASHSCANCGTAIAESASSCPACGRVAGSDRNSSACLQTLMEFGSIRHEPDGSATLTRSADSRQLSLGILPSLGMAFLLMFLARAVAGTIVKGPPTKFFNGPETFGYVLFGLVILFCLTGIVGLLWTFTGRDEWRFGPGYIERTYGLAGFERTDHLLGGQVILETGREGGFIYPAFVTRTLILEAEGRRIRFEQRAYDAKTWSRAKDSVEQLGQLIALKTGWPLEDDRDV
jgi:hypothetical protein